MSQSTIYLYVNGNSLTPSTRLRWLNYTKGFKKAGLDIRVLECASTKRERLDQIRAMETDSVVLVQKKFLSFVELIVLRKKMKHLLLDVDDAIWRTHPHKGNPMVNTLKRIYKYLFYLQGFRFYETIVCANETLASALRPINKNLEIVPTSPSDPEAENVVKGDDIFRIVWTGTHANFFYLDEISAQISGFLNDNPKAEFCVISDGTYELEGLKRPGQIRNIPWSTDNESLWIQKSSLGIMPLTLDEWSRGKSAFKLIKYMKLGLPVMATDFGFQKDMIKNEENGVLVDNSDWQKGLTHLFDNPILLKQMADAGHQTYLESYAPDIILESYLKIFKSVKEAVQ